MSKEVDPRIVAAYEALVQYRTACGDGDPSWQVNPLQVIDDLSELINEGVLEIPVESSAKAAEAINAVLTEYAYPANPTNAARAGWRAARLFGKQPARSFAITNNEQLRREWILAGGSVHGPRIETVTMPEAEYFKFRRSLSLNTDESFNKRVSGYEAEADRMGVLLAAYGNALRAAQAFILRAYQWDSDGPGKYPTLHTIAVALGDPIVERQEGDHPL